LEAALRRTVVAYGLTLLAVGLAVLLRWLLDPIMGDSLALVTLYGAVAFGVWIGGYRPALVAIVLGYLACSYLFIPPRGTFVFNAPALVGLAAYLFTCAIIVGFGEAKRASQRPSSLLASIVESSDDAIVSKTADGMIQSWNAAAERLFGYSAAEAIGRPITIIIPSDRQNEEKEILRRIRAGERVDHFETVRVRKNGEQIQISLTVSPVLDESGQVVGASKIARDISERKKAEERIHGLLAELQQADRRKDEFLALLSHELRGPLAPLRNTLEIIKRSGQSGETDQAHETMERQLAQLVRLVDDLLDVSRITHNKIALVRDRADLAEIIGQAVEAWKPLAESQNQCLSVSLPPRPISLNADAARLVQVFGNLLNNACKYTPAGGSISVTVEQAGSEVLVKVKDTGMGIPSDRLASVFDMFTQVERTGEASHGGLGLGLTLVKRLVEMHEGGVTANSEGPGKGSEFVVRLPIMNAPQPSNGATPQQVPATTKPRRVLVVDDNTDAASSLAMLLKISGNEAHTANEGLQAIEVAETIRPDVMLLDIGMPNLDGLEVCRRIRAQPWGREMLIIALTGWGQEEDRRKSKDVGFDYHLVKPVDFPTLVRLLAESGNEAVGR
jgi:PAS domain S-box-containing protein